MVDFGGVKGTTPTMKRILLAAALSAGLATSAGAAESFTKSVVFTTSGYRGASALADFPVLVKLPGSVEGFDYADVGPGTNLLFKDAGGAVIPHEVDVWDTNGTSLVWVRVPSVTAETTFTMYYDGASDAESAPSDVWTVAGYVGVWHMDEADGAVADATGHGLAATPASNATVSVRYTRTADVPVGHARETGVSGTKGYLSIPSYDSFNVGDAFTMSGWVRLQTRTGNPRLFSRKAAYNSNNGWEFEMNNSDTAFMARGASQDKNMFSGSFDSSLQRKWTHVALVYDGSTLTVYGDVVAVKSADTITPATDNNLPLSFGCDSDGSEKSFVEGAFDECRLLAAAASADWIAAEYATVTSDAFVTAGEIISTAPVLDAVAVSPAASSATISGTVLSLGMGNATWCDVYLAVGTSPDDLSPSRKIASYAKAADSFSARIPNLWARTTYYYTLSVTNNAQPVAAGSSTSGSFTTVASFNYNKRVSFTVNSTNENDFAVPVLVRLSKGSPAGFDPRHCAEGGRDLFFADANGDELPCEVDTWDPAGESLVWVRLPSVRRGTTFTMYYRGTPSSGGTAPAVWSDYAGVWHLNELGADATQFSQGLYPNSTAEEGIGAHLSTDSVPGEAGRFGKAFRVNGSTGPSAGAYNAGGAWVNDSGANSPLDGGGFFTISGWFKHGNWNFNWDNLFYKRMNEANNADPTGSFMARISSQVDESRVSIRGAGTSRVRLENAGEMRESMIDNWVYLTLVFNGTTGAIYENGALCRSGTFNVATDNDAPLVFGNTAAIANGATGEQAWNGWIDEVRYLKGAKSSEWIAAEYAAMADPGFLTAGAAENVVKPTVIVVR